MGRRSLPFALLAACLATCGPAAPDGPKLLLLVSVDTLRADHLGAYGGPAGLTPQLDALAARSVVFTSAYAPASFTLPSVSALLTGRLPEENGIFTNEFILPQGVPTIATALRERGWRTGAVVSNYVLRAATGLDRGFEVYDDEFPQVEAVRALRERTAVATTDAALALLDELTADPSLPALVWVHYQDPHGPYTPPPGLRERFLDDERARPDGRRTLRVGPDHRGFGALPDYQALPRQHEVAFYRAGYAGEVRHVDEQVGRLLAGLAQRGLDDRATIVFTADHGESLGEDGVWFAHGENLTDVQVRVPLLLRVPGRAPARRDDVVALTDLFVTLLASAGVAPDGGPGIRGRDLLADGAAGGATTLCLATLGGSSVPRLGLIDGGFKLALSFSDGAWQRTLHRLGEDEVDLARSHADRTQAMLDKLAALRKAMERRDPVPMLPDDEARRELDALGYVGGR